MSADSQLRDLRERQGQRAPELRRVLVTLGLAVIVLLCGQHAQVDLGKLFSEASSRHAVEILSGLGSPDLTPDFLTRVLRLMLESLAIGALGMALALLLGVPLAVLAARLPQLEAAPGNGGRSDRLYGLIRTGCRALMAMLRSIPEIVWAFLLVRILGLGPGPAVLAIGLTFAGIIGKLYAELLEACDPVPIRNLRAVGTPWLGVLLRGALPQVRTLWVGYGLVRFECALRSASILGVVGAGGIGSEIDLSIRYFQYDKLGTALLAVLVCIVVFELLSSLLRRRGTAWSLALLGLGVALGALLLDIPWSSLFSSGAVQQGSLFVAAFGTPTTEWAFVTRALGLMGETLTMALWGTVVAAVIAFFLAPLATRKLTFLGFLPDAPRGRGVARWLSGVLFVTSRLLLQVTRALPELVWALIFVVWVGPGPFAGALAVAAYTVGILGRLFSESYGEAEPDAAANLEAVGVGPLGRWGYGVLPQVAPRILAYSLFRFEVNVRATAMVGFVGAGGIGDAIHTAISLFHMADLATLLLVLLATVVVVDMVGDRLRVRILRR